jgi:uncharacterized membrane protein
VTSRAIVVALALVGFLISAYLAAFQLGIVPVVADPIFGAASSEAVLKSSFSRALPSPDALLGAVAYMVEVVLDSIGGERRYQSRPWIVLLFGVVAAGAAAVGVLLVALQALVIGSFCALCLASAAISWLIFVLAVPEVVAAVREVRSRRRAGAAWRAALFNRPRLA